MNLRAIVAVSFALGLAAACGPSSPEPKPPTGPAPTESASAVPEATSAVPSASAAPSAGPAASAEAPAAPSKSWDAMSHDERVALMKTVVMPKMKEAFQKFDAKKFADFGCKTCHGKPENKGKMPNEDLPKLDFKDNLAKHKKKTPEELDFMAKVVTPEMVKILGLQPYDMKTHTGFGCGGCHTFEK